MTSIESAASCKLDIDTARLLAHGRVTNWHIVRKSDNPGIRHTIAVELDTGRAGDSLVVYVQVPEGDGIRGFRPYDQVSLVMSEAVRAAIATRLNSPFSE